MPTHKYIDMLYQIQQLSNEDQLRLLEDLTAIALYDKQGQGLHNVMEFKGIAGEAWKGVDVEKYINEERNSWDG